MDFRWDGSRVPEESKNRSGQMPEIYWDTTEEVVCFVSVKDTDCVEVMTAQIKMKVSPRKK